MTKIFSIAIVGIVLFACRHDEIVELKYPTGVIIRSITLTDWPFYSPNGPWDMFGDPDIQLYCGAGTGAGYCLGSDISDVISPEWTNTNGENDLVYGNLHIQTALEDYYHACIYEMNQQFSPTYIGNAYGKFLSHLNPFGNKIQTITFSNNTFSGANVSVEFEVEWLYD